MLAIGDSIHCMLVLTRLRLLYCLYKQSLLARLSIQMLGLFRLLPQPIV